MITLLSEKRLYWGLGGYVLELLLLTAYSAITSFSQVKPTYTLVYYITAYVTTIAAIVMYMLNKQKAFNELNDKFLRSSFKDELTQLYNRKLLDLILEYQESLYTREQKDYILVMFDIDDFKAMNDHHGHVFGDIILRSVAECIKNTTRESDFVVRYGGDEFLVIQTNASQSSVLNFLDRIEEKMETACQMKIDVAVSFGYALRSECEVPEAVLQRADERLYQQKDEKKALKKAGR